MTYPWKDPEISKHYDPKWTEFLITIAEKSRQNLESKGILEKLDQLSASQRRRLESGESFYLGRDVLKVYLPIESFKDDIKVTNTFIPSFDGHHIPIKVYKSLKTIGSKQSVHINFHGGGFAHGGLHYDEYQCFWLAHLTDVTIIDVDYRLVPENHLTVAFLDALSVFKTVSEKGEQLFNIDRSRLSVGGYSAGGKLSLALAHLARDLNIPLNLVIANVPVVQDFSIVKDVDDVPFNGSFKKFYNDPNLNFGSMVQYETFVQEGKHSNHSQIDIEKIEQYFGTASFLSHLQSHYQGDIYCAPNFSNLPNHIVVTAETDVLGDGGRAYAAKLINEFVEVKSKVIRGLGHSHHNFANLFPQSREYLYLVAKSLKGVADGD
ncbi:hypothetical protein WICMUC_002271 [Wickerhamomyces mucosus]|uniref:Alpha/beta hydrolase fold-3 domain-containing protein n=1 Tax=Wickerhamomyces mucosus TaxID=1378264 RepID=A0A9P8PR00_9ASCO|nr:hypothetical protein WICMUC_002271 [Wickerhamomyces mucosus]